MSAARFLHVRACRFCRKSRTRDVTGTTTEDMEVHGGGKATSRCKRGGESWEQRSMMDGHKCWYAVGKVRVWQTTRDAVRLKDMRSLPASVAWEAGTRAGQNTSTHVTT